MAPRVVASILRRPERSLQDFRENGDHADIGHRAFWRWATMPQIGNDARELLPPRGAELLEEQRVLSKAASGGGFLVPDDVANQVVAAARATSVMAQLALEYVTDSGATLGGTPPLAFQHPLWKSVCR